MRHGDGQLVGEVERGQEGHRPAGHDVEDPRGALREHRVQRVEGVVGVQQLDERVVAQQHRHHALAEDAGVEGVDPRPEQGREAQDAHPEPGVAPRERDGVLLGLHLVPHPGERGLGVRPPVLGQEVRVLPPRPVHRGERAQHEVPDPGRGRRRRQVQRADRLELVGVGGVAARGREEGGVDDRCPRPPRGTRPPGAGRPRAGSGPPCGGGRRAAWSAGRRCPPRPPRRRPAPRPAAAGRALPGTTRCR